MELKKISLLAEDSTPTKCVGEENMKSGRLTMSVIFQVDQLIIPLGDDP